jgi:hypothetical protein
MPPDEPESFQENLLWEEYSKILEKSWNQKYTLCLREK